MTRTMQLEDPPSPLRGTNAAALDELSGNTSVDGHVLFPPEGASEGVNKAGEYERRAPLGALAVLVAALAAARSARRPGR